MENKKTDYLFFKRNAKCHSNVYITYDRIFVPDPAWLTLQANLALKRLDIILITR